jgi:hypothetical protein
MSTELETVPVERGTLVMYAAFTDHAGASVVPNAGLCWTLTDQEGGIINHRERVAITPAATVTIVLHGDDLALTSSFTRRILTIEGTYDSTLGTDLELKAQAIFNIEDLIAVE